eukprot:26723-Pleurochrysis_carterae.AAC.5
MMTPANANASLCASAPAHVRIRRAISSIRPSRRARRQRAGGRATAAAARAVRVRTRAAQSAPLPYFVNGLPSLRLSSGTGPSLFTGDAPNLEQVARSHIKTWRADQAVDFVLAS